MRHFRVDSERIAVVVYRDEVGGGLPGCCVVFHNDGSWTAHSPCMDDYWAYDDVLDHIIAYFRREFPHRVFRTLTPAKGAQMYAHR